MGGPHDLGPGFLGEPAGRGVLVRVVQRHAARQQERHQLVVDVTLRFIR